MIRFKLLKELFDRKVETLNEEDVSFLVYKNRFNEIKPYQVEIIFDEKDKIAVRDIDENKMKTFTVENILSECGSFEEAIEVAANKQELFAIIPRNKTGRTIANRKGLLEVCFTGFPKNEKAKLIKIAEDNDMFVRTRVTQKLDLLVCGEKSGWKKLEEAKNLGVAKVYGYEGFENFIDTGEIAE
jgi:NAD-dependent DNA ligase